MKPIYKINLLIIIVLLILSTGNLMGQNREETKLQHFDYDVVIFPGNNTVEKARVSIYVWVRNTHLQYVTMDTMYRARYQVNLEIFKNNKTAVLTRDTTVTVTENRYATTIDPNISRVHHFQYSMSPNKYLFKVRLLDLNSGGDRMQEKERNVFAIAKDEIGISDILFLDKKDLNTITPQNVIPRYNIPIQDTVYIYTEVMTPEDVSIFDINASISQRGEAKRFTLSNTMRSQSPRSVVVLELTKGNMRRGQNQISLIISAGQRSAEKTKLIRFIQSREGGEIAAAGSTDDMIAQLGYVARGDEWKNLRNAEGEDRDSLFKEFWKKRDPTPGTVDNELYDEYYKRVRIANQRFSAARKDGWRSDRGRVYIIYGPPDSIEKFSPTGGGMSSYEVWYYDELREKFVFFDEYGFGEYRLVSGNL